MKIQVFYEDGIRRCEIICDYCGGRIPLGDGIVKFEPVEWHLAKAVHKGKCDLASEGGKAPDKWPWEELTRFLEWVPREFKRERK